jgi:rRNA maturation RNase YbeY
MSQIKFFYQTPLHNFKNRTALKTFLSSSALTYNRPIASLNIIFCSDEYLLSINQGHLQHDYYTDIITFDLSPSVTDPIEGELYISVDRVKENAILHEEAYLKELHRVVFHGLLHLLGFKDKNKADQEVMRTKEDDFLAQYFA